MDEELNVIDEKDFEAWLEYGYRKGWCDNRITCTTHDLFPLTKDESNELEVEGTDPCIHALRMFQSKADQQNALKNSLR